MRTTPVGHLNHKEKVGYEDQSVFFLHEHDFFLIFIYLFLLVGG